MYKFIKRVSSDGVMIDIQTSSGVTPDGVTVGGNVFVLVLDRAWAAIAGAGGTTLFLLLIAWGAVLVLCGLGLLGVIR